jgi:hypothetical protein
VTSSTPEKSIPVVDVDQAFPTMAGVVSRGSGNSGGLVDTAAPIQAALRDILGWRPRVEDPKAFTEALRSSFRLRLIEGHIESEYVPRGYAVQSDLGAVTGGQASFYRRAQVARTEVLRILDGLVPLRTDSDSQDVEAYRGLVRNAVQSVVDELGAAGGARVEMVDAYFQGLTGTDQPTTLGTADGVAGQLGALRERLGLIDDNVNTVEEEGIRTSYWTLVDMVVDLQSSWTTQRDQFAGTGGFLGTELIRLSRLMEAAADQIDELESVLDSVLVPVTERRTIVLNTKTGLTLDGLLSWMRAFLSTEARRIAQDGGRDGIVSALTPTAIALLKTFKDSLADRLGADVDPANVDNTAKDGYGPVQYLPASCCSNTLPTGLYAVRTRIATASLCRLLTELARTAQRIGRWSRVVLLNITIRKVLNRGDTAQVELRGLNLRRNYIPAFVPDGAGWVDEGCSITEYDPAGLVRAIGGSSTADDETISALFHISQLTRVSGLRPMQTDLLTLLNSGDISLPAEDVATAVIDGEAGTVVYAPIPRTWPSQRRADEPIVAKDRAVADAIWQHLPDNETLRHDPELTVDPTLDDDRANFLRATNLAQMWLMANAEITRLDTRDKAVPRIISTWKNRRKKLRARLAKREQIEKGIRDKIDRLERRKMKAPTDVERLDVEGKIARERRRLEKASAQTTTASTNFKDARIDYEQALKDRKQIKPRIKELRKVVDKSGAAAISSLAPSGAGTVTTTKK